MGRANPAWKKLREYFRRLGSCYSSVEFVHVALVEAREVIPFYDSAGVFDSRDLRCLEGIGNPDACTEAYNDYYRRVMPPPSTYIVDWSRRDDEFAVDFMRPWGMAKTLWYSVSGYRIEIKIQRSQRSPQFNELDLDNLMLVSGYLNNLFAHFDHTRYVPDPATSVEALADKFRFLSQRETEVCSFLARRMNTGEIAATLFLSARTVEKHIQSIFEKLDVHSREQLRWRLSVMLPTGIQRPQEQKSL